MVLHQMIKLKDRDILNNVFSFFLFLFYGFLVVRKCVQTLFPPLNCVSEKYLIKYSFLFAQISYSGCSYRFQT